MSTILGVAIIGKENEPLYAREFAASEVEDILTPMDITEEELFGIKSSSSLCTGRTTSEMVGLNCSLRYQFVLHSALDRFDQLGGVPPGFGWRRPGMHGTNAMFVGLLFPFEETRVYGYMTTTKIKIVLIVEDDENESSNGSNSSPSSMDERIKELLVGIHELYVQYTLNPFSSLNDVISSKQFDCGLDQIVFNFSNVVKKDTD